MFQSLVKLRSLLTVSTITFLASSSAWAWGDLGHRTVAEIAWAFLDVNSRNQIESILQNQSLADASTWADAARPKPEWKFTSHYHFEKIPDNAAYLDTLTTISSDDQKLGDLIQALFVAEDTFTKSIAIPADRQHALKFLIHFIGDMHQPLHTGRVDDIGGNKIKVTWLGFDMNLHQIWDSQIIYLGHEDFLKDQDLVTQSKNYADYLLTKYKAFEMSRDSSPRYDLWLQEAMSRRIEAYDSVGKDEKTYTAEFLETIDHQIFIAGFRLATTLSRLIHQQAQPGPLNELKEQIIKIVGNFYDFVSVKPQQVVSQPELK